ncbi:COG4648 family protein [Hydrogenovibrio kuenenii]|uniref:hypothetical protein n=1 Tax=Hydrogenovibrio kuenenii TaxID=63658 RepID=UPI000463C04C|nr:hypothetical protein [Hydrogenovibrio kuenenii]
MLKTIALLSISISIGIIGLTVWSNNLLSIATQMLTLAILVFIDFVFILSLKKHRIPIITRYAYLIDGDICERRAKYTRQVTQAWVTMLTLVVLAKLLTLFYYFQSLVLPSLLAYLQPSLFAGLAILFFGEYAFRQLLFGNKSPENQQNENFKQDTFLSFLKNVARIPIHEVLKSDFSKPEK